MLFLGTNCSRRVSITAWDIQRRDGSQVPAHHTSRPLRSVSEGFRLSSRGNLPGHLNRARISQPCLFHSVWRPGLFQGARNVDSLRCVVYCWSRQLHAVRGISLQLPRFHKGPMPKQQSKQLQRSQLQPHSRRSIPSRRRFRHQRAIRRPQPLRDQRLRRYAPYRSALPATQLLRRVSRGDSTSSARPLAHVAWKSDQGGFQIREETASPASQRVQSALYRKTQYRPSRLTSTPLRTASCAPRWNRVSCPRRAQ